MRSETVSEILFCFEKCSCMPHNYLWNRACCHTTKYLYFHGPENNRVAVLARSGTWFFFSKLKKDLVGSRFATEQELMTDVKPMLRIDFFAFIVISEKLTLWTSSWDSPHTYRIKRDLTFFFKAMLHNGWKLWFCSIRLVSEILPTWYEWWFTYTWDATFFFNYCTGNVTEALNAVSGRRETSLHTLTWWILSTPSCYEGCHEVSTGVAA